MLVIEDAVLARLATKPLLAAEFPFIKAAVGNSGGCACNRPAIDTNAIKSQIASLSPDARKRFKELAEAPEVRVIYSEAGQVKTATF